MATETHETHEENYKNNFEGKENEDIFYTGEEDCETDIEKSVRTLVCMKQDLDRIIRTTEQIYNSEFYEIYDKITKYIQLYCNHEYLIDITPERCQIIHYCTICKQLKP